MAREASYLTAYYSLFTLRKARSGERAFLRGNRLYQRSIVVTAKYILQDETVLAVIKRSVLFVDHHIGMVSEMILYFGIPSSSASSHNHSTLNRFPGTCS